MVKVYSYQTEKCDKPAKFVLVDAKGIQCIDARNTVRFALAGDGALIHNLGTGTGSRQVELYNGRAIIRTQVNCEAVVSVSSDKVPTALLTLRG
jgi:beta-galactosidase